ncbi:putative carbohydrate esterase family 15 protein [Cladorrhinum samala]|uniref:(4-O-methyl)-D-glucuronate--lignin esterase n=1 Tax=Cladorrhinum samala TaxID=585594 RepID=A0AAV9HUV3_9PEZI|nr:putative carbohydrate esterase family 15 protein [Cladorrhinum samala]
MMHHSLLIPILALAAGTSLAQTCGTVPNSYAYANGSPIKLPDPFTFLNGTKVVTKADWACRQDEISSIFQRYELGPLPAVESVSATFASNKLSITVTAAGGKTLSFSATVKLPSGSGPFPALIALGGVSIPVPSNVAVITYNNEEIAATDPRGKGKFFDLYGKSQTTGGLLAWAWGVSRIVDALEKLGPATTKINPARLAVTGCSRNGKGALMAGAFDKRIRLTLPQEAGSGGMGCWRIVGEMKKNGTKVEDAAQIVNGDQWFATSFTQYVNDLGKLPYDHHMLAGLVAPRPLLVIENSGIDYLGPISTYGCSTAGRLIYSALGEKEAMGLTQVAHGSSHCQLPSSQNADVAAFFDKYLLDKAGVNTDIFKTDKTYNFQLSRWVDWTAPTLG